MAQQNVMTSQLPGPAQSIADQLKAFQTLQQNFTTMASRLESLEKELASFSSSDGTASEPDTASDVRSVQSSIRTARSLGFTGQYPPLLSVTAMEGNRSFSIIMERRDITGIHKNHLMPGTKSSTERYGNAVKKLVEELWPRESRIIKEEFDGPYYKVQRRDPTPPYRPRNKRYHLQASFNNTPWQPTQSGYYDIDPRAWDRVLFIASSIRIICKDVTTSHGQLWFAQ